MKLSDQKLEYTKRIQMIWERQHAALSAPGIVGVEADTGPDGDTAGGLIPKKANAKEDSDSDSESGDNDFFEELEEDLERRTRTEANKLLAGQTKSGDGRSLDKLRAAAQDHDLSKEAKELAEFQREEKKAKEARENLKSMKTGETIRSDRKIVRRRITKTHPDGRQTITFKFMYVELDFLHIMPSNPSKPVAPACTQMKLVVSWINFRMKMTKPNAR